MVKNQAGKKLANGFFIKARLEFRVETANTETPHISLSLLAGLFITKSPLNFYIQRDFIKKLKIEFKSE